MRKWLVFISVLIAVLSFSQILNYVPTDFKAIRYVKNLSDFYGELKTFLPEDSSQKLLAWR